MEHPHPKTMTQKKGKWALPVIFAVLCCVVIGVAVAAMIIAINSSKQRGDALEGRKSSRNQEHLATEMSDASPQEHIEVIGDGRRLMSVKKGSKLRHWKHSTRTGKIRLRQHSEIIIKVPGLYRIYGQYAVYKKNRTVTEIGPVNVLVMQNINELSMSVLHHCRLLCTRAFAKTARLQMGDKLWLKSNTGGSFFVDEKYSYFGVNLLQCDEKYVN